MPNPVIPSNSNTSNLNEVNSLMRSVQGLKTIQVIKDTDGIRRILFGRLPDETYGMVASKQGDDVMDAFGESPSGDFRIVQQFNTTANNTQGICLDDNYFYISEASKIIKYTRAGVYVAEHDTTGDGSNHHLGDIMIKDGILYVTSSAYPSTPYNEIVMSYDAEALTYIEEWSTFGAGNDHIGEGIDYRLGHFWTVSDNYEIVYKWEAGFTSPTSYPITEPTITGSNDHFQTIVWLDDETIVMQLHGGPSPAFPETVLKYRFNGSSFTLIEQYTRPNPIVIHGQGLAWDEVKRVLYFANRNDAGGSDSVTGAKFVTKLAFDSRLSYFKIVQTGILTVNLTAPATQAEKTITHNLNFTPAFLAYMEIGSYRFNMPYTLFGTTAGLITYDFFVSDTTLTARITKETNDSNNNTLPVRYYLLQETAT